MWRIATDLINLPQSGSTVADIFMRIFSADTWLLSSLTDSYITRRWNNAFFSGNVSPGTGLVIKFDLVKCTKKNKYKWLPNL